MEKEDIGYRSWFNKNQNGQGPGTLNHQLQGCFFAGTVN
jgi:hypothetical protein